MSFLERIVASRRKVVDELEDSADLWDAAARRQTAPRDFRGALVEDGMSLIAEIKRRSPSKGDLNPGLDASAMAASYERAGARAVSVLTEPEFFGGSADDVESARRAVRLPVLWKDFVLDPVQIVHARSIGADAILLIVRMTPAELPLLVAEARSWGMCPLVEIFDEDDLDLALDAGADVVGVNHRDLETFEEDPTATARLRKLVPDDVLLVAESAITTRADVEALDDIGVHAMLVGEAIVTAPDPEAKIRELLGSDAAPAAPTDG
jgi:indole-3-glycerol phosphate synthase